jgi:hypothetical protein
MYAGIECRVVAVDFEGVPAGRSPHAGRGESFVTRCCAGWGASISLEYRQLLSLAGHPAVGHLRPFRGVVERRARRRFVR